MFVIDGFTISSQNICVRCRHVEKIIVRSILYILPGFLKLEVNRFRCIGDRSGNTGKHHTYSVDYSGENFIWIMGGGQLWK